MCKKIPIIIALTIFSNNIFSQDSLPKSKLPNNFIDQVDNKLTSYTKISDLKTIKTLSKLVKWENKIKNILTKVKPQLANKLFNENELTFEKLLNQYKFKNINLTNTASTFNSYIDNLDVSIKYIKENKSVYSINNNDSLNINSLEIKSEKLNKNIQTNDALNNFINERKKQLWNELIQLSKSNKYLKKISKEVYYYKEKINELKNNLTDNKRAEALVMEIINKSRNFQSFFNRNSQLASLFNLNNNNLSLTGMQTRASLTNLIQDRFGGNNTNFAQEIRNSVNVGRNKIKQLQDKIMYHGNKGTVEELPNFKPNSQKSKSFLKRIFIANTLHFTKANSFITNTGDLGLNIGYKLNDHFSVGVGGNFKAGLGNINKIKFTNQGMGYRTFIDYRIKENFYINGGYESNNLQNINNEFLNYNKQKLALLGITKKINTQGKFFKGSAIQILYDFLSTNHQPISSPITIRYNYNLK